MREEFKENHPRLKSKIKPKLFGFNVKYRLQKFHKVSVYRRFGTR